MDPIEQTDPMEWIRFESILYILYLPSQHATSNKYSTYSIYSSLINTHTASALIDINIAYMIQS